MIKRNANSISRVSRVFQYCCWVGIVGIPILIGCVWLFGTEALLRSGEATHYLIPHGVDFEAGVLNTNMRITGLAISLIPGGVVVLGLLHLARLFGHFSNLEFFTLDTVRHFRVFAITVVMTGVLMPLAGGILSFATSADNPAGERFITLTAGDAEVASIFLGSVMLMIAWVMEQGKQLTEEYEGIV